MNNLCPICSKEFDFVRFGGTTDMIFYCTRDQLYMCPNASYPDVYRGNYYLHYLLYAREPFSEKLNRARWQFVIENTHPEIVLDFGCGAEAFGKCVPSGIKVYSYDPYFKPSLSFLRESKIDTITFWDSLEHMRRIELVPLLRAKYLAMSVPILQNPDAVFEWRHFRPDEHVWCFTEEALVKMMKKFDYSLVIKDDFEICLGRHDIYSYVFEKGA